MPQELDSITIDNIRKYFRKARNYMFAYLEGYVGGKNLEDQIKRYKKIYASHRKASMAD